jgi:hypothetical protein
MDGLKLKGYSLLREQEKSLTTSDKVAVGEATLQWMCTQWNLPEDWVQNMKSKWFHDKKGSGKCTWVCSHTGIKCGADLDGKFCTMHS